MKFILLLFLILPTNMLFAQHIAEGKIKDSETGRFIPYANIGIVHQNIGTVSGASGTFKFEMPSHIDHDSVRLSCVGYQTKTINSKEFLLLLAKTGTITLDPEIKELNEVVISGKNLKEKILGNKTKSKMLRGGFRYAKLGHELGIKIKIKDSPTYISAFHTNIVSNSNETMKFRINFYNIKNGLPNEKIYHQNIIFQISKKEGLFTLDLSKYNIIVHEDFYCTIELIENQRPEDTLFFSAGLLANKMAYRLTSHGEWDTIGGIGIGFSLTVEY